MMAEIERISFSWLAFVDRSLGRGYVQRQAFQIHT